MSTQITGSCHSKAGFTTMIAPPAKRSETTMHHVANTTVNTEGFADSVYMCRYVCAQKTERIKTASSRYMRDVYIDE